MSEPSLRFDHAVHFDSRLFKCDALKVIVVRFSPQVMYAGHHWILLDPLTLSCRLTSTSWAKAEVLLAPSKSPAMAGSSRPKLGSMELHSRVRMRPDLVLRGSRRLLVLLGVGQRVKSQLSSTASHPIP